MKRRSFSAKKIMVIAVCAVFVLALVYTVTFDMEVSTRVAELDLTGNITGAGNTP